MSAKRTSQKSVLSSTGASGAFESTAFPEVLPLTGEPSPVGAPSSSAVARAGETGAAAHYYEVREGAGVSV